MSNKKGTIFICHLGVERSKAGADAFNESGLPAEHFEGGTKRMASMSQDDVNREFSANDNVTLIYDPRSREEVEADRKEIALKKLKAAGVKPNVIDSSALRIMIYENGKDPNDYLH